MRNQIIMSLYTHAEGHISKHLTNVEVYLNNPVGIGEHSDIMEAIEHELAEISKYHDQIEVLDKYLNG